MKTLSLSQATLLLFLKSHRGWQSLSPRSKISANVLQLQGFVEMAGDQAQITGEGLKFAYEKL